MSPASIEATEELGDEKLSELEQTPPWLFLRADLRALVGEVRRLRAVEQRVRELHRHGQSSVDHRCRTGHWESRRGGVRQWVEDDCPALAALDGE